MAESSIPDLAEVEGSLAAIRTVGTWETLASMVELPAHNHSLNHNNGNSTNSSRSESLIDDNEIAELDSQDIRFKELPPLPAEAEWENDDDSAANGEASTDVSEGEDEISPAVVKVAKNELAPSLGTEVVDLRAEKQHTGTDRSRSRSKNPKTRKKEELSDEALAIALSSVAQRKDKGKAKEVDPERAENSAGEVIVSERRREKMPMREPISKVMPERVVQRIVEFSDPETYASLLLLDKRWREICLREQILVCQLTALGIGIPPNCTAKDMYDRYMLEVRTSIFGPSLRPRCTEIRLISSSPSSAGAFPGGDSFRFEFSPKGKLLVAYSSSRLVIFDLSETEPRITRELKVTRRPTNVAILDDSTRLAVLSSELVVSIYDLTEPTLKLIRSITLENNPRTIALSPQAAVLAAAFNGGIEVYSLNEVASAMDQRSVSCDAMDNLKFSADGTMVLGTTVHSKPPSTVIISAPFFSADMHPSENLAQMWTTQVLFPRSSRDSSHATLLPESFGDEENGWAFSYDRVFEIFRAVRVDDLRNGQTYFPGPLHEGSIVAPGTLPSPSDNGNLVAVGFRGGDVYIYGIPEVLEVSPPDQNRPSSSASSSKTAISRQSSNAGSSSADPNSAPKWRVLQENPRNTFVPGHKVTNSPNITALRFSPSERGERLIGVSTGGLNIQGPEDEEDELMGQDGGRIYVFEFSATPSAGARTVQRIEIGVKEGEDLPEEETSLESRVDLVRRRTIARNRRPGVPGTTVTTPGIGLRRSSTTTSPVSPSQPDFDEAFQDPFAPNAPRSRQTIARAATVRQRPQHALPPRAPIPQYDDRDGWVAPPPAYSPNLPSDEQRIDAAPNLRVPTTFHPAAIAPVSAPVSPAVFRSPHARAFETGRRGSVPSPHAPPAHGVPQRPEENLAQLELARQQTQHRQQLQQQQRQQQQSYPPPVPSLPRTSSFPTTLASSSPSPSLSHQQAPRPSPSPLAMAAITARQPSPLHMPPSAPFATQHHNVSTLSLAPPQAPFMQNRNISQLSITTPASQEVLSVIPNPAHNTSSHSLALSHHRQSTYGAPSLSLPPVQHPQLHTQNSIYGHQQPSQSYIAPPIPPIPQSTSRSPNRYYPVPRSGSRVRRRVEVGSTETGQSVALEIPIGGRGGSRRRRRSTRGRQSGAQGGRTPVVAPRRGKEEGKCVLM